MVENFTTTSYTQVLDLNYFQLPLLSAGGHHHHQPPHCPQSYHRDYLDLAKETVTWSWPCQAAEERGDPGGGKYRRGTVHRAHPDDAAVVRAVADASVV